MRRSSTLVSVWCAAVVVCVGAANAAADELRLSNGDVVQGTIAKSDQKSLTFKHAVGGTWTVPWKDVLAFTSAKPITLRLTDGSILKGIARYGPSDRTVTLEPVGAGAITGIAFDRVLAIGEPPPAVLWTGAMSAGLAIYDGNTRGKTSTLRFNAQRKSARDLIETRASYNYSEDDDGDLTARNGNARIQYNYDLADRLYVYVGASFEYDRFKFLNLRSRGGGGFGVSLIEETWIEWRLEVGISYVNEDLRQSPDERFTSARFATTFRWDAMPDRIRFRETLELVPSLEDRDDFTIRSASVISFDLWGGIGLGISVIVEYDESPPPGAKHRADTKYQATVTWTF